MKRIFLFTSIITIIGLIVIFGCNSGGQKMQASFSNGILLSIEKGEHWQGKMKWFVFSVNKTPQLSIWIEDEQGNYISTVTATGKSVRNNWSSAPKEGRPEALPVWNHKRLNSSEQIDIVSSATPKGSVNIQIDNNLLTNGQTYNVCLEINHSFDYNNFWTESNSGVNGQPSLIYHAKFIAGTTGKINLIPIGHGSVDGSNGNIVYELDSLTTALLIINNVYMVLK